mmetsp:Transcript_23541/g.52264  ORF Transcript_23541/g.52264 Transcript_23541/m.52264 type:complete len:81 (+) Transcript_23541:141-383(+)
MFRVFSAPALVALLLFTYCSSLRGVASPLRVVVRPVTTSTAPVRTLLIDNYDSWGISYRRGGGQGQHCVQHRAEGGGGGG